MSDKIDLPPVYRSPPNSQLTDRRKKPEDKPKRDKNNPPKRKPEQGRENSHIDEYV